MSDAIVEDTKIEIEANNYRFQLDGQQIIYDGFLRIYEEASLEDSDEAIILPEFKEGEILDFRISIPNKIHQSAAPLYRSAFDSQNGRIGNRTTVHLCHYHGYLKDPRLRNHG